MLLLLLLLLFSYNSYKWINCDFLLWFSFSFMRLTLTYVTCVLVSGSVKSSTDLYTHLCSVKCVHCMTLWCRWRWTESLHVSAAAIARRTLHTVANKTEILTVYEGKVVVSFTLFPTLLQKFYKVSDFIPWIFWFSAHKCVIFYTMCLEWQVSFLVKQLRTVPIL